MSVASLLLFPSGGVCSSAYAIEHGRPLRFQFSDDLRAGQARIRVDNAMYKIDNLSGTTALTRQSDRINQRLTSEVSGASSGGAISAALASLAAQQLRHASHVLIIRGTRAPFRLVSVQSVRVGMAWGK